MDYTFWLGDPTTTVVNSQFLNELEEDSIILGKLYENGVDNWAFYDDAISS